MYVSIRHDEVGNVDYLYGWLGCLRLFLISHVHLKVSLLCTHHSFYFTSIIYNLSHTIVPNAFMFPTPYSGATDALPFFFSPFFVPGMGLTEYFLNEINVYRVW